MERALLKQVTLRKDADKSGVVSIILPPEWLKKTGLKRGDLLNIYDLGENSLQVSAEKNPFGQPQMVSSPGRKPKEMTTVT